MKISKNAKTKRIKKWLSLDAVPYKQRQWGHAAARNAINAKQKLGLGLKQQKGTGFKPWEVAKYAEKVAKKLIPSTKPVFDRYWKGDIAKNAFMGPTGVTSKKFWTHPKKGTVIRLLKNPKTGKYENVYEEP